MVEDAQSERQGTQVPSATAVQPNVLCGVWGKHRGGRRVRYTLRAAGVCVREALGLRAGLGRTWVMPSCTKALSAVEPIPLECLACLHFSSLPGV